MTAVLTAPGNPGSAALGPAYPVAVTDILALTHEHMVEPPLFLPLAARCFARWKEACTLLPCAG